MKLFISIFILLLCSSNIWGQEFETLLPQDYPVGEALPLFCKQLRLADGETPQNTEVIVEYPEVKKLTNNEIKSLKKVGIELPEQLEIQTTFGMERKKGVIDVSFIPFIKKDGQYVRLTSIRVSTRPKQSSVKLRASSSHQQRYSDSSALATGKWVKISVSKEGIYELTQNQIKQWGFSDINRI